MGGNVGIQALSVSIRSIALGDVQLGDIWRVLRKEFSIGIVNGLALGGLFAILAIILESIIYNNYYLSYILGCEYCSNE